MPKMEIWYAQFPAGKKRGRSSSADNIPRANSRRSALLVARAVVVNEWIFLHQLRFEYFEGRVVDCIV